MSRRDWLKLGAAGTAAWALPTLHLASADGPDGVAHARTDGQNLSDGRTEIPANC